MYLPNLQRFEKGNVRSHKVNMTFVSYFAPKTRISFFFLSFYAERLILRLLYGIVSLIPMQSRAVVDMIDLSSFCFS